MPIAPYVLNGMWKRSIALHMHSSYDLILVMCVGDANDDREYVPEPELRHVRSEEGNEKQPVRKKQRLSEKRLSTSFEEGSSGLTLVNEESTELSDKFGGIPFIDLSKIKLVSRQSSVKLRISKASQEVQHERKPT